MSSGRGVWRRKCQVEECYRIDIHKLRRFGALDGNAPSSFYYRWPDGSNIGVTVVVRGLEPYALRLNYTTTDSNEEKTRLEYDVLLDETACFLGGSRRWFMCPLYVNGQKCRNRCRYLYRPPGSIYFGCRSCHDLTYESRQKHRNSFYEGLHRPRRIRDYIIKAIGKVRSPEKRRRLFERLSLENAKIRAFYGAVMNRIEMQKKKWGLI
jgi:hypothetical protein